MSNYDEQQFAEDLRAYFVEHAPLPVKGGAFLLDDLPPDGRGMSLQIDGGTPVRRYIDGTAKIRQPFTIRYRSKVTDDNDAKSEMMGDLNAIGNWMRENGAPYLGDWLRVSAFEQIQRANIADKDNKFITYQAGYVLEYTTL